MIYKQEKVVRTHLNHSCYLVYTASAPKNPFQKETDIYVKFFLLYKIPKL